MAIPPRDAFAAYTRRVIEDHEVWDRPATFQTLHWDGEALHPWTHAVILPDVAARHLPAFMAGMAKDELDGHPDEPAYAYLLQFESHAVAPLGLDATEAERRQLREDQRRRSFHRRADAIEIVGAWCADIHGRLWSAVTAREDPGRIQEKFYPPGRHPDGLLIRPLLSIASATGALYYGLAPVTNLN
jgi:hypothetical protein